MADSTVLATVDGCRGHVSWRPRLGCYSVWAPVGGVKGRMEIEIDRVDDMAEGAAVLAEFHRTGRYRTVYARRQCPEGGPPMSDSTAREARRPTTDAQDSGQAIRRCPVQGCGRPIGRDVLMCRGHWHRVPVQLRSEVRSRWRDRLRALAGGEGYEQAAALHEAAKAAAIRAVEEAERR